jgi:2-iminobutanoate/2-iminopropanoate deaminase
MTKLLLFILLFVSGFAYSFEPVEFLSSKKHQQQNLPFSKATKVGNLLFLSGELGVDPATGQLVQGGIQAETKQLMQNISATLKKYNSSLERVAKCTVFLADIKEWSQFNQVYVTFFNKNYPARSAMAGSGLGFNARVEIECIAVVNDSNTK